MNKRKDFAIAAVMVVIVAIFAFGMIYWPDMPKDKFVLKNLYYITIASVMYMLSWVVFMVVVNNSVILKVASCLGVAVFSVNLYIEIFLDPTHWTKWNLWLILFVGVNLFLSVSIIEIIRKNKK